MKCVKCGGQATVFSKEGIPVCSRHRNEKVSPPSCPECKSKMILRKGKYGLFWGCIAFPMCDGIQKL